jgi:hypothetical protein
VLSLLIENAEENGENGTGVAAELLVSVMRMEEMGAEDV